MWQSIARLLVGLSLLNSAFSVAQSPSPAPPEAAKKTEFFAGIVTEINSQRITVSRSVLGKPAEHHTFLINPKTKVSRTLKTRTRVTVRYETLPEGDVAVEVQIHVQPKSFRPTAGL